MIEDISLPLAWRDGEVLPINLIKMPRDTELEPGPVSLSFDTMCYATQALFFDDFFAWVSQAIGLLDFDFPLLRGEGAETFLKDEIRRLHIRNKAYGWVKCHLLIRSDGPKSKAKGYLFLHPYESAFDKEQMLWQLCLLSLFPRPSGSAMNFPAMENAYRRLTLREVLVRGCHDGVLVNESGSVTGTCTGNLFVVKGNQVTTPSVRCGIPTIPGRQWIIGQLQNLGLQVNETDHLFRTDLYHADELFVLGCDGLFTVKGLDTARYYDLVRLKLLDAIQEKIKNTE